MALEIGFWVLAALLITSAILVVVLRNVFRAALALVVSFIAVAGLFITLSADFLAMAQILIYVGAVAVVILLAVMLTREAERGSRSNSFWAVALGATVPFVGLLAWGLLNTSWTLSTSAPPESTLPLLSSKLFSEDGFLIVVEMAGVLLLVTIVGAITIVKRK